MLFLYTHDFGWSGGIAVIATSPEEATRIATERTEASRKAGDRYSNVPRPDQWDVHPIEAGACVQFYGDQ